MSIIIFHRDDLDSVLNRKLRELNSEINSDINMSILDDYKEFDEYLNNLFDKYFVKAIQIEEVTLKNRLLKYVDLIYTLKGSNFLVNCKGSSYRLNHLKAIVNFNSTNKDTIILRHRINIEEINQENYKEEINKLKKKFQEQLEFCISSQSKSILNYNVELENKIIENKERIKNLIDFNQIVVKELELTVNKETDNFINDTVKELKIKKIPTPGYKTKVESKEEHEVITMSIYTDILNTLNYIGKSIEKKPSIYKNNSEEDLRNIFQLILETRYDNTTVTGETFNKAGKTDILVKGTNNNNLFIAELKYWGGSKQISKVVNQLESYLTIRDTKSSLVFFVENKDFGNVETQIFNEIKKHKHYKHQNKENLIIDNGNTFTFEKNGKEYLLHVLMFHFQK